MNTIFDNIYTNNWDNNIQLLKDNINILDLNIQINNIYALYH